MADEHNRLLCRHQPADLRLTHSFGVEGDDPAWLRVEAAVEKRGQTMTWLAHELGMEPPTVLMWKSRRRLPPKHYAAVAAVLRESVDWVAGLAEESEQGAVPLSPMAARIAREFDTIRGDEAQLDAFAKIIGLIAAARKT